MRKSYQHEDFVALCSELVERLLHLRRKAEAEGASGIRNSALLEARYPGWREKAQPAGTLPTYLNSDDPESAARGHQGPGSLEISPGPILLPLPTCQAVLRLALLPIWPRECANDAAGTRDAWRRDRAVGKGRTDDQPGPFGGARQGHEVEKTNFSSRFSQSTLQRGGVAVEICGFSCLIIPPPGGCLRVGRGLAPPRSWCAYGDRECEPRNSRPGSRPSDIGRRIERLIRRAARKSESTKSGPACRGRFAPKADGPTTGPHRGNRAIAVMPLPLKMGWWSRSRTGWGHKESAPRPARSKGSKSLAMNDCRNSLTRSLRRDFCTISAKSGLSWFARTCSPLERR
jgi:hypothetical protein